MTLLEVLLLVIVIQLAGVLFRIGVIMEIAKHLASWKKRWHKWRRDW